MLAGRELVRYMGSSGTPLIDPATGAVLTANAPPSAECSRCVPARRHLAKLIALVGRRLRRRRCAKLDATHHGIHLHVEASEDETSCTFLLPTDCSDGRPSDTEELLGGRSSESIPNHPPPVPSTITNNINNNPSITTTPTNLPQQPTSSPGHHQYHHYQQQQQQQNQYQQSHPEQTRPLLDFEEFECDVAVEGGGVGTNGPHRQEFSFTLYDFEGHGKITKDDIASLVRTIYDTLGSSIKVPHYGSKTIRVKLTVSPDQRVRQQQPSQQQQQQHHPSSHLYNNQETPLNNATHAKMKSDLNVTIRESRLRRPVRRRKQQSTSAPTNHSPSTQMTSVTSSTLVGGAETLSSCRSSTSSESGETPLVVDLEVNDDSVPEAEPTEDSTVGLLTGNEPDLVGGLSTRPNKRNSHASSMGQRRERLRRYTRNPRTVTKATQPPPPPSPNTLQPTSSNSNTCCQQLPERKSGSMQREELLQIIQANMDKNNLTFQTSRKAYFERNGLTPPQYRPRQKTMHSEFFDSNRFGGIPALGGVTSCYLDLADDPRNYHPTPHHYIPHPYSIMSPNNNEFDCRFDKFRQPRCRHHRHHHHHRSRSHETGSSVNPPTPPPLPPGPLPPMPHTIPAPPPLPESTFHQRSKSHETTSAAAVAAAAAAEAMAQQRFVLGHTSSPHHLKHRNREQDQARAMAQVVKWLEQEFSLNKSSSKADVGVTTTTTTSTNKLRNDTPTVVPGTPTSADGNPGGNSATNTSNGTAIEHHHVHEHIHHHYHHYQEAPVLV